MKKTTKLKETTMYFRSIGDLTNFVNESFTGHCIKHLDDLPETPFVGGYMKITVHVTAERFDIEEQDERLAEDR